jgi:ketosteroid isomerase-like protein
VSAETIGKFIASLNECWQQGEVDRLADYYHTDVVLLPPDLGTPIRGRDAVVSTYRDFLEAAQLDRFETLGLDVFSYPEGDGGCHVAHLTFEVDYLLDGSRYQERGLEVYVLRESGGRLQIVWRQQSVLDSRLAEKSAPR